MNRQLKTICAAIFVCLAFTTATATASAAGHWGDLDPTFGTDGVARPVARGLANGNFTSVVVQPDGRILVAGTAGVSGGGNPYAVVFRLLANGQLDTSFGGDGAYFYGSSHAGDIDTVESIKLQGDGKIVAVGSFEGFGGWGQGSLIFRLNSNGTLDTDADSTPSTCFGPSCSGRIEDSLASGLSQFSDVHLTSSGDIVAAGGYVDESDKVRLLIRKFDSAGAPIGAYNAAAASATQAVELSKYNGAVRLLENFNELAFAFTAKTKQFAQLKLTGDGTSTGEPVVFGANAVLNDAIIRDGATTFGGSAEIGPSSTLLALGKTDSLGTPNYGPVATSVTPGDSSSATALGAYPDGNLIALGVSQTSAPSPYVTTSVFTPGGAPYLNYGQNATITYPSLGSSSTADAIELLPNGKALLLGSALRDGQMVPFIARILGPDAGITGPKAPPSSKISSPLNSTIRAKKLQKFRGTAGPAGGVAKVELALQRVDKRLIKRERHCLWLRNSRAKFTKNRSARGKCLKPRWLQVKGKENWSFSLLKTLPKGNYVLSVRATNTDGSIQAQPTVKRFKIT